MSDCDLQKIKNLQAMYGGWLAQKISVRVPERDRSVVEITTPFLDRRNDCIQIYAFVFSEGTFILSDHGYTLQDSVGMSGRAIDGEEITVILNGFGVKRNDDDSLQITAEIEDFPMKQNNLIQAMIAIDFAARREAAK